MNRRDYEYERTARIARIDRALDEYRYAGQIAAPDAAERLLSEVRYALGHERKQAASGDSRLDHRAIRERRMT
jgi:hypothetical protein